jgi:DNA-binding NtrC family response regulator
MIAERRKVLTMLHEHKINVDEAEGLLDALEQPTESSLSLKVEYVTANQQVEEVLALARKASPNNAPVLIVGEAGTGKELVARVIHHESPRQDKAFVYANCVALTQSFEWELFGYERGAFTGAIRQKTGLMERANGGTLFFDEVSGLRADPQFMLLRFLETGEFERVGGTEAIRADVRVIAATDKDLNAEVKAGRFRQDLFDHLSVITLEIPPLRERVEDIPLLADYFLKRYAEQYGKSISSISPEAMDVLKAYTWPGNVRELSKVIQGALVLCDGAAIQLEHLPDALAKE